MSSKINILAIVKSHFRTLTSASTGKVSLSDLFTFVYLPIFLSILIIIFGFKQTDSVSSLLVNFGAIFTALLLSVLVLVYDQGNKLADKSKEEKNANNHMLNQIRVLLEQLYDNICYSIVLSVSLVFLCLMESIIRGFYFKISIKGFNFDFYVGNYMILPIIIFITINLMLTILMIVKRLHTILTIKY